MQKNYDQNDTIQDSDWIIAANAGTLAQQRAAEISAPHHNSPQRIDFDTLGRPFCTTDDNMTHGLVVTHNTLDIAGRPIALTDALGRVATTRIFAMSEKHLLSVQNIDSGRRRMLSDVAGKPIGQWDSRGHKIRYTYDALQRPVAEYVSNNGANEFLAIKNVYGSSAVQKNIGRIHQIYDQSGLTEFSAYDFKGNPLEQKKKFCQSYNAPINWGSTPLLQAEVFTTSWAYNALNQPLLMSLPDGSSQQNTYNKAGLLETVSSNGQAYVTNINYNEKGQRSDIFYGNGSKTRYEYDELNFRLTRLLTTRNSGLDVLQDVSYIYDPVGNIVEMKDQAQQTHFFNNAVIEPRGLYEYDALYRLVKAQGREKSGLGNAFSNADMGIDFPIPHNGANSLENYTHLYAYDKLGNIMSMNSQGKWLRNYAYAAASNLLLKHDAQQTTDDYTYDAHGNITRMPGIEDMQWNYADYLAKTQCGTVNTWYVYDQAGNRSRKITEKQGGIREERIYLGGFEVYRKYQGGALVSERSTVHIMDDKSRVAIIDRQTVENGVAVTAPVNYRYQYSNHLGSASLELDQTAQIISYEEYHPFGTTSYWSGQSESEVKKKRYRYVGKERDEETGLYYYGARYYAAWIGRFVSVDPLQFDYPQLTPFNYAGNKPVTHIDIDGMQSSGDEKQGGANGNMMNSKSLFGGMLTIPHNSILAQVSTGEVLSFSYQGDEYYFDPSIKWYSTLDNKRVYDPVQIHDKESAPRYVQAAFSELIEMGGPSQWGLWWNKEDGWARVARSRVIEGDNMNFEMIIEASTNVHRKSDYPEVGKGESIVPIWGSGKQAYYDFSDEKWGWGLYNSALAVSDVFLLKSIAAAPVKALANNGFKGVKQLYGIGYSNTWSATKARWSKLGINELVGGSKHHWAISQKAMKNHQWLLSVGNQPWNIVKFSSHSKHMRLGEYGSFLGKSWYGTPTWFKLSGSSVGGRAIQSTLRE